MKNEISVEQVLEYIRREALRPLKYQEICQGLNLSPQHQGDLNRILGQMEKRGDLLRTRRDQYGLPEMMQIYRGVIRITARGFGVVLPENAPEDVGEIFVMGRDLNGAMHEDKILVRLIRDGFGLRRSEGEVVRILHRASQQLVGTYHRIQHSGQVIADDPHQIYPVIVRGNKMKARNGDKVLVEITVWPGKNSDPEGRIVEIFGKTGQPGSDLRMVIRKHGLRDDFPLSVTEEARSQAERGVGEKEPYRRDLRDELLITIDGEDAKDLDDAVSITALPDGWRLGVHIADVSHYVHPGTELDEEAYARGTSVYLLDTVLPMLPPELSNGICSLNAGEDRLAMSCVMELDKTGKVMRYELFHSLICVRERMTYTAVNALLEGEDETLCRRYQEIVPMLQQMKQLAEILRAKRRERGALDFDFPEAGVRLDEQGKPLAIYIRERGEGERLIEDFMIQANEVVARHLYEQQAPILYRVHEKPEPEALSRLKDMLTAFSCRIPPHPQSPKAWQQVLEDVKGQPYEETVSMMLLRSLRHAEYRPEAPGHFGLASEYYCHFTSPIRRYPDLIVHRTLSSILRGTFSKARKKTLLAHMPEWGEHCSRQERRAEEAERNLLDCKKIRYMQEFLGEVFAGRISSVLSFGFFVRLENTVEGLVHISTLEDDYYQYDEKTLTLTGGHTGQVFHIGDPVEVILARADADELQIDFELYRSRKNSNIKRNTAADEPEQKGNGKTHEQKRQKRKEEKERKKGRKKSQKAKDPAEDGTDAAKRTGHSRRNREGRAAKRGRRGAGRAR